MNGWKPEELEHGYVVSLAETVHELQRIDELDKFENDYEAANRFRQDLEANDPYAIQLLEVLVEDYKVTDGEGRNGAEHDMDMFNLWRYV